MLAAYIRIQGIEKLEQILDKRKRAIAKLYKDALTRGCIKIVADAKKIAPFQFGALRANITYGLVLFNLKEVLARVGVRDIIDYAQAVEEMHNIGKKSRKPGKKSPYLYPSVIQNQKYISDQLKEATLEGFKA